MGPVKRKPLSVAQRRKIATELNYRFPIWTQFKLADHRPYPDFVPFTHHTHDEHQRALTVFYRGMFAHDVDRRISYYILDLSNRLDLSAKAVRAYAVGDLIRGEDLPIRTVSLWRLRPGFVDFS